MSVETALRQAIDTWLGQSAPRIVGLTPTVVAQPRAAGSGMSPLPRASAVIKNTSWSRGIRKRLKAAVLDGDELTKLVYDMGEKRARVDIMFQVADQDEADAVRDGFGLFLALDNCEEGKAPRVDLAVTYALQAETAVMAFSGDDTLADPHSTQRAGLWALVYPAVVQYRWIAVDNAPTETLMEIRVKLNDDAFFSVEDFESAGEASL